jgi:hypothetical protein
MPIRVACPNCHQLLGVSERKAGSRVKCPKCAGEVAVPTEEKNAELAAFRRFEHPEVEEAINRLVVVDRATDGDAPGGKPLAMSNGLAGDGGSMLQIPRNVVYFQAGLLAAVALVFFLAGWWIGGSGATIGQSKPSPANGPPIVDVLLHYRDAAGQLQPDDGAAVLLLPAGIRVIDKLSATPLDPARPMQTAPSPINQRLQHLGGAYGRTNGEGRLLGLNVPDAGEFHMLLLSNHSRRQGEARPQDLATLGSYLEGAAELLADRDYRLTTVELRGRTSVAHEFGQR